MQFLNTPIINIAKHHKLILDAFTDDFTEKTACDVNH